MRFHDGFPRKLQSFEIHNQYSLLASWNECKDGRRINLARGSKILIPNPQPKKPIYSTYYGWARLADTYKLENTIKNHYELKAHVKVGDLISFKRDQTWFCTYPDEVLSPRRKYMVSPDDLLLVGEIIAGEGSVQVRLFFKDKILLWWPILEDAEFVVLEL